MKHKGIVTLLKLPGNCNNFFPTPTLLPFHRVWNWVRALCDSWQKATTHDRHQPQAYCWISKVNNSIDTSSYWKTEVAQWRKSWLFSCRFPAAADVCGSVFGLHGCSVRRDVRGDLRSHETSAGCSGHPQHLPHDWVPPHGHQQEPEVLGEP